MKKTDIDKAYKEKFLEHEQSASYYKADYWKDFEKQLDEKKNAANHTWFKFSLNQILIFFTSISLVAIFIYIFYNKNNVTETPLPQATHQLTEKNIIASSEKIKINESTKQKETETIKNIKPENNIQTSNIFFYKKEHPILNANNSTENKKVSENNNISPKEIFTSNADISNKIKDDKINLSLYPINDKKTETDTFNKRAVIMDTFNNQQKDSLVSNIIEKKIHSEDTLKSGIDKKNKKTNKRKKWTFFTKSVHIININNGGF